MTAWVLAHYRLIKRIGAAAPPSLAGGPCASYGVVSP